MANHRTLNFSTVSLIKGHLRLVFLLVLVPVVPDFTQRFGGHFIICCNAQQWQNYNILHGGAKGLTDIDWTSLVKNVENLLKKRIRKPLLSSKGGKKCIHKVIKENF